MNTKGICRYCEEIKTVRVWRETGEMVCLDCRINLLEQEFDLQPTLDPRVEQIKEMLYNF